jgi:hypothetical protein
MGEAYSPELIGPLAMIGCGAGELETGELGGGGGCWGVTIGGKKFPKVTLPPPLPPFGPASQAIQSDQVIGSARTAFVMTPQTTIPNTIGLRADIANLLFEPKETAVMTIPTATAPPFNPPLNVQGPQNERPSEQKTPVFTGFQPRWIGEG